MMLCTSHIAGFTWNGSHPEPKGNSFPFATLGCYRAADHDMMIAASNLSQQRRLWIALDREDMIKTNNHQRIDDYAREAEVLAGIIRTESAGNWEAFFRKSRVPAARIRRMEEALSDPQILNGPCPSLPRGRGASPAASASLYRRFRMSESRAGITLPPQAVGAQTDEILSEIGYAAAEITALRKGRAIN